PSAYPKVSFGISRCARPITFVEFVTFGCFGPIRDRLLHVTLRRSRKINQRRQRFICRKAIADHPEHQEQERDQKRVGFLPFAQELSLGDRSLSSMCPSSYGCLWFWLLIRHEIGPT